MKKKYTGLWLTSFVVLALSISLATPTYAKTPTQKPTIEPESTIPEKNTTLDKIRILKEKVATKVAELRQKNKVGFYGKLESISATELTILNSKNETIKATYTEDTPVFTLKPNKKAATQQDMEKKEIVVLIGYYDKDNKTLEGRAIYIVDPQPVFLYGKIKDIDRENFTITLNSKDKKDAIIDIETYTKTQSLDEKDELVKSGFSRLVAGDVIQIIGSKSKAEDHRYLARRILVIEKPDKMPQPGKTKQ